MLFQPRYIGLIERYRDRLPVSDNTKIISIGEGSTPLIKLSRIPEILGKNIEIYVKYEGLNPTSSFKDRGSKAAKMSPPAPKAYSNPGPSSSSSDTDS